MQISAKILPGILQKRAQEETDRLAFVYLLDGESDTVEYSYGRLDRESRAVGAFLEAETARGSRVIAAFPFSPAFTPALFGCLYSGRIAVPTPASNLETDAPRIRAAAQDCGASLVLCTRADRATLDEALPGIPVAAVEDLPDAPSDYAPVTPGATDTAFLQYTSGSTSAPKGVMVSHGALAANLAYCREVNDLSCESAIASWLPHFFDMALLAVICLGPYAGCPVVQMAPAHFVQKPLRWLQAIERYRATMTAAPNFAFDLCVQAITEEQRDALDLSSCTSAICGGERVNPDTIDRFAGYFGPAGFRRAACSPGYGLAEATLAVAVKPFGNEPRVFCVDPDAFGQRRIVQVAQDAKEQRRIASMGPLPDLWDGVIVDVDTGQPCGADQLGEIWLRGDSLAQGYWNKPDATQDTFGARLPESDDAPWLRTGDIGAFIDGELVVIGRQKDVIIIRGFNHYAQDIEHSVKTASPELKASNCAAFAVQEASGDVLVVVVEPTVDDQGAWDSPMIERQTALVREAVLRDHGVVPGVVVITEPGGIPRTGSGKVQRVACQRAFEKDALSERSRSVVKETTTPRSAAATQSGPSTDDVIGFMRQTVADYLGVEIEHIDPDVPFRSLGLDSTTAVRLSGEVAAYTGRDVPTSAAFDYPTIDALARHLTDSSEQSRAGDRRESEVGEPVAIVGMACRFPGAPDLDAFWSVLSGGVDAITEVPRDRWDIDAVYDPEPGTPGKMHTRWGGFLDNVAGLDAPFFRMTPQEGRATDPQQRLLLEVAWEALEHAGIPADTLAGSRTGVFVGIGAVDYLGLQLLGDAPNDAHSAVGASHAIASNRLSYFLGLEGPSMSMDTACSSALTAVHQAMQSLRGGESDMALAGAVNLTMSPVVNVRLSQARMLSPTGRCRTFDAAADGYSRGEGCGVVVLKRLRDALADGDHVLAVLRGAAVNHSGQTNGITAPKSEGQIAVMRAAMANGGIIPAQIDYIEAHGTGTPLGDPVEFHSLTEAVLRERPGPEPCRVASVKTNIGHLEIAAGMAGLIKTVLCMQREAIAPHLHLDTLNPRIETKGLPVEIPASLAPWPAGDHARTACVNAFGFGGTNACVVLTDAPRAETDGFEAPLKRNHDLFMLSAHNTEALEALADRYAQWLDTPKPPELRSVCANTQTGRSHMPQRLVVTAKLHNPEEGRIELARTLRDVAEGKRGPEIITGRISGESTAGTAFLYTGQGAQYPGMGKPLFETEPLFRAVALRHSEQLEPVLGESILDIMFGDDRIHQTCYAQPALFILEQALTELWASWGVYPIAVLGHSVGEIAAACAAGALSPEDGLRMACERGRLLQSLPTGGTMAAVFADRDAVESALSGEPELVIAAYNGPNLHVISGPVESVERALSGFDEKGTRVKRMAVSHAFHSPRMDPILDEFAQFVTALDIQPLAKPFYSTVRGTLLEPGTMLDAAYWRDNIRQPVRFVSAIEALCTASVRQFVEIGPDAVVTGMAQHAVNVEGADWLGSIRRADERGQALCEAVATLHVRGHHIDWSSFAQPAPRLAMPTYPFQRKQYWCAYGQEDARAFGVPGIAPGDTANSLPPEQGEELRRSLVRIAWQPLKRSPAAQQTKDVWLVLTRDTRAGEQLAAALREKGLEVQCPPSSEDWQRIKRQPQQIVFLATDETELAYPEAVPHDTLALHNIIQNVLNLEDVQPPTINVVTRGAQQVGADDVVNPAAGALWGLHRTLGLEHPELAGALIDLPAQGEHMASLADVLLEPCDDKMVAFRDGAWYAARLERIEHDGPTESFVPRKDATYLITGGLGALGRNLAQWLADHGARRLVLTGRTALPPRDQWGGLDTDSLVFDRVQAILDIEKRGATVFYAALDVADRAALERWSATFDKEQHPPIRGVFHLAGVLADASLGRLTEADFDTVFRPKILGAWNLHHWSLNRKLDHFALYSSAAGMFGSPGQGNYAAANAWLDSLAMARQAQGLPALSISWGPWAEAGMAARPDRADRMERMGIKPLAPELGAEAVGILLGGVGQAHVGVVQADWNRLGQGGAGARAFLADLLSDTSRETTDTYAERVKSAPPQDRASRLRELLRHKIAAMLGMDESTLELENSPEALGVDSLVGMDLVRDLSQALDFTIVPREFYRHPTLAAFADYLADAINRACLSDDLDANDNPGLTLEKTVRKMQSELQLAPPSGGNPSAVFVLSAPRSGSTLLRAMLSAHPGLFAPPELHLLWFSDMQERQQAFDGVLGDMGLGNGLTRALMALRGLDSANASAQVMEWIDAGRSVQDVYRTIQEEAAPRLLVDKSPTYGMLREVLDRAESMFDNARYVFLHRHPYAAMASIQQKRMWNWFGVDTPLSPARVAEEVWTLHNQNLIQFGESMPSDRWLRIDFESLVTRPRKEMEQLCDFLGLSFSEAMLDPYAKGEMLDGTAGKKNMMGDAMFHTHSAIDPTLAEKWREHTPRHGLLPLTFDVAAKLGYDLGGPPQGQRRPDSTAAMEEDRL